MFTMLSTPASFAAAGRRPAPAAFWPTIAAQHDCRSLHALRLRPRSGTSHWYSVSFRYLAALGVETGAARQTHRCRTRKWRSPRVPSGSKSELQLRVGGGGSVELTQKAPARPALNLAAEDAL